MQAKKRYILVFLSCAFLAYCYFGGYRLKSNGNHRLHQNHHHHSYRQRYRNKALFSTNAINSSNNNNNANTLISQQQQQQQSQQEQPAEVMNFENSLTIDDGNDDDSVLGSFMTLASEMDGLRAVRPNLIEEFRTAMIENTNQLPKRRSFNQRERILGNVRGQQSMISSSSYSLSLSLSLSLLSTHASQKNRNIGKGQACRMETCFDFERCRNDFLVYVYPPEPLNSLGAAPPNSLNYQKIVTAIRESRYYTTKPELACLFVLGIDTLDRDSLSEDYVRNVPSRLARLPYWNNGRNHVIFNLYSGTWPDYAEHSLGFDSGEAILAKASMSIQHWRPDFDISIPLFHKQFPLRSGGTGLVNTMNYPSRKKYLLAFKGKR